MDFPTLVIDCGVHQNCHARVFRCAARCVPHVAGLPVVELPDVRRVAVPLVLVPPVVELPGVVGLPGVVADLGVHKSVFRALVRAALPADIRVALLPSAGLVFQPGARGFRVVRFRYAEGHNPAREIHGEFLHD